MDTISRPAEVNKMPGRDGQVYRRVYWAPIIKAEAGRIGAARGLVKLYGPFVPGVPYRGIGLREPG